MKTSLLIPGNSLTKCHYGENPTLSFVNTEWTFIRPHVLLWADEIFIEKDDFKNIVKNTEDKVINESLKLVYDRLKKEGIIKTFDALNFAPDYLKDAIDYQVTSDAERWKKYEPEVDKKTGKIDLNYICINGMDICPPKLYSFYYSLSFSRLLNSECLLNTFEFELCKRRFGEVSKEYKFPDTNPFQIAFNTITPNIQILGSYAIHTQCDKCKNKKICQKECVEKTDEYLSIVLDLRKRDELRELKGIITESKKRIKDDGDSIKKIKIMSEEIQDRANKHKELILKTFPRLERWANITTAISLPISFAASASNEGLITLAGIGLAGASQGTKEILNCLKSKYKWVTFYDELKNIKMK